MGTFEDIWGHTGTYRKSKHQYGKTKEMQAGVDSL